MKIAILGLGYVGLTAAGCLTKQGHEVLGIDVSDEKVGLINSGACPITEPGLEQLISRAREIGLLNCTTDVPSNVGDCDIALVCVGTPSAPDGSHNMSYIAEVSRQLALSIDQDREVPLTVVYRSTVRPGTIETLVQPIFKSILDGRIGQVELVYNPEFLRESVAIRDYFEPPKIVVGTADGSPSARVTEMYAGIDAPTFHTRYGEAEITKFVDNTFHAMKVAFANEIGRVCVKLGISAEKVHEIFVSDTKLNISPYYLRPGGAFGGSCLPKDVRALQHLGREVDAGAELCNSLLVSNETHKRFILEYCTEGLAPGASVLMVGLAFKANSDDLRESPNLDLARRLLAAGYKLSIVDPALDSRKITGQNLGYAYSNLPSLADLLIDEAQAREQAFDVVIDTSGTASELALAAGCVIDISTLR